MSDRGSESRTDPERPEPRPPTAQELHERFGHIPENWWTLIPAFAVELVATDGTDPSGNWPDTFFLYRHRLLPSLYGIAPESRLQGTMDMDFTSDRKVSEGYYERIGQTGRSAWEDVQPMVAAGHDAVTWGTACETLEELRALRNISDEASIHRAGPRLLAQLEKEGRSGTVGSFRPPLDRFIVEAMITLHEASTNADLDENDVLWALGHADQSIREQAMLALGTLETGIGDEGDGLAEDE